MNRLTFTAESSLYATRSDYYAAAAFRPPVDGSAVLPQQDPTCMANCQTNLNNCQAGCQQSYNSCTKGCVTCQTFTGGSTGGFWSHSDQCVTSPLSGASQCCTGWYQCPQISECSDGTRTQGCKGWCF